MMYYTTRGDIRGGCGHKHKTVRTAVACLQDDAKGCRKQGGYSDRRVLGIEDCEEFEAVPYTSDCVQGRGETLWLEVEYLTRH